MRSPVTLQGVFEATCVFFKIPEHELASRTREPHVVEARQIAWFVCRQLTTKSLTVIARAFGGWDHTTVLHGIQKVKRAIDDGRNDVSAFVDGVTTTVLALALARDRHKLPQPEDIDALKVALRVIEQPLSEMAVSVNEIRAMASEIASAIESIRERLQDPPIEPAFKVVQKHLDEFLSADLAATDGETRDERFTAAARRKDALAALHDAYRTYRTNEEKTHEHADA